MGGDTLGPTCTVARCVGRVEGVQTELTLRHLDFNPRRPYDNTDKRRSDCNTMKANYYIPNKGDSVGIRNYTKWSGDALF